MGRGARREREFGGGHEKVEHEEGGPRVDDVLSKMNEFYTVDEER